MSDISQTSLERIQQQQNIPVTRVQVDGNSVVPLLRAFATKAYANNVFNLAEAAKLHEVFQFIDNLSVQAQEAQQQQQETEQIKSDVESVTSAVDAVADAVEDAVNKKISSE